MHCRHETRRSARKGMRPWLALLVGLMLLRAAPGQGQSGKDIAVVLKTVGDVAVNRGEKRLGARQAGHPVALRQHHPHRRQIAGCIGVHR
ncbi:MAG: hypothetical protein Q9P14_12680 [candidate division KSB1 bacterium]|nr:hypothetical protein [candidate division KSB1 bacterium]